MIGHLICALAAAMRAWASDPEEYATVSVGHGQEFGDGKEIATDKSEGARPRDVARLPPFLTHPD